jgi:hypothetical protein
MLEVLRIHQVPVCSEIQETTFCLNVLGMSIVQRIQQVPVCLESQETTFVLNMLGILIVQRIQQVLVCPESQETTFVLKMLGILRVQLNTECTFVLIEYVSRYGQYPTHISRYIINKYTC